MAHQAPDQDERGPKLTRTGMAVRIIVGAAIVAGIAVLAIHPSRRSPPSHFMASPHGGLSEQGAPGAHS